MTEQTDNISIDDAVLVRHSKSGDAEAMQRLIIKYQDRIYNTILKICTNTEDAAELTQETFVKFIEKINTFKGNSAFYTWLFRIAVNLTINHCRRQFRFSPQSIDALTGGDHDDARASLKDFLADENAEEPSVIASNREVEEILYYSLSQLDEHHRAVITLRDIEGMSYAQIGEVLSLELGTVKSRQSRARNALKEILESVIR
jgi:RNA polymerase sigma-70 factor (ECF subfamily)